MNGAVLEDSILEQVARLESAVRQLKPAPDIQPILDHLAAIERKIAAIPKTDLSEVVSRMTGLEEAARTQPEPPKLDIAPIASRLEKLEAAIKAKGGGDYEFTIKRDATGRIEKVTATRR